MKRFIICFAVMFVGCVQSYNSTRVGPDRYVVVSQGHDSGPENYGYILQEAYKTCTVAGFRDYNVSNVAFENRRVVAFITCGNNSGQSMPPPAQEHKTEQQSPGQPSGKIGSFMDDVEHFLDSTKKRIEDQTQ